MQAWKKRVVRGVISVVDGMNASRATPSRDYVLAYAPTRARRECKCSHCTKSCIPSWAPKAPVGRKVCP
jgi:hypothetical protein